MCVSSTFQNSNLLKATTISARKKVTCSNFYEKKFKEIKIKGECNEIK